MQRDAHGSDEPTAEREVPPGHDSGEHGGRRRFLLRSARRVVLVDASEIDWIEADGNYVRLHHGSSSHLMRHTMAALERELDPARFVRIHRSRIVRIDRVREFAAGPYGDYEIHLRDGRTLAMSRAYRHKFLAAIVRSVGPAGTAAIRHDELHIQKTDAGSEPERQAV